MSTARDEAITRVDKPGLEGALARLIPASGPGPTSAHCRDWLGTPPRAVMRNEIRAPLHVTGRG